MSDDQVQKLRRTAGSAVKPGGRIRSLRTALLVAGMPTASTEVAPIIQLSRMVWKGVVNREEAESRGASLADLVRWWEDAKSYIGDVLKENADRDQKKGGQWATVRGPLAAAALSAKRIGWTVLSPISLVDDRGVEIHLTASSPALIKSLLRDGVRRSVERSVAQQVAAIDERFRGRRVCVEIASRVARSSKALSNKEQGLSLPQFATV